MFLIWLAAASLIPEQPPQTWFSNVNYPAQALAKNAEGTVQVDLTIQPSGRASDCKVISPANESSLNEQTCAVLLERSKFVTADKIPALKALHHKLTVKWILADPKLDAVAYGSISEFVISNNRIADCRERLIGDEQGGFGDACEGINGGPKELLDYLMNAPIGPVSKGALSLLVQPIDPAVIDVTPARPGKSATLFWAEFEVLPSGAVTDCRTIRISDRLPRKKADMCDTIRSEFHFNSPAGGKAVHMRAILELEVS